MFKAIVSRIYMLMRSPFSAWIKVVEEDLSAGAIQNTFFYPLVALLTLATIAGTFVNNQPPDQILRETVIVLTSTFAGYYISVIILNEIIDSRIFNMEKQYVACVAMIAYSSSVMLCINAIVALVPSLFILYIVNFYTAYIIWEGADIIFKGLNERQKGFFTIVCFVLLYASPYLVKKALYLMMR